MMTLNQAQRICNEIESDYARRYGFQQIKWNQVFNSEEEIIEALKMVYIPKNRTAPPYTFRGYAYIYSFAYYVQKGWTLSAKQMTQCKRNALEIKKAAEIADYKF